MTIPHNSYQKAQTHFFSGQEHELRGRWDDAMADYEELAQICHNLGARAMESLAKVQQARVHRNKGEIALSLDNIKQANVLLAQERDNWVKRYVFGEVETLWGALCQKQPLPEDKQESIQHFEKAINLFETIQADLEIGLQFANSLSFLIPSDRPALRWLIAHNIAVNKINLAETFLHEGESGRARAYQLADEVKHTAEVCENWQLLGAAARIKGEIAEEVRDWHTVVFWLERALFAYRQHGFVNPEALSAVENKLRNARMMLSLDEFERVGKPEWEGFKIFEKVPRLILFLNKDKRFLFSVDSRARTMPAGEAWRLYYNASIHWGDAGWFDKSYGCLVKVVECLDYTRSFLPLAGGDFIAQRRTDFFATRAEGP